MTRPSQAGFYWAKWLYADGDTADGNDLTPCTEWEVVCVFENSISEGDTDFLRVLVTGVETSQSITSFEWIAGPLEPPNA
jgi:hypothetical protein